MLNYYTSNNSSVYLLLMSKLKCEQRYEIFKLDNQNKQNKILVIFTRKCTNTEKTQDFAHFIKKNPITQDENKKPRSWVKNPRMGPLIIIFLLSFLNSSKNVLLPRFLTNLNLVPKCMHHFIFNSCFSNFGNLQLNGESCQVKFVSEGNLRTAHYILL